MVDMADDLTSEREAPMLPVPRDKPTPASLAKSLREVIGEQRQWPERELSRLEVLVLEAAANVLDSLAPPSPHRPHRRKRQ